MSTTERYVQAMQQSFRPDRAQGLNVTYQLQITGNDGGAWTIRVANQQCQVTPGAPAKPDTSITMSGENYMKLAAGQLNVTSAYQQKQIQVGGNLQLAQKFSELFVPWASKVQPAPTPEPAPKPKPKPKPAPDPKPATPQKPTLAGYVQAMPKGFRPDRAGNLQATYQFQLSGPESGTWTVTIANRSCTVAQTQTASPTVSLSMSGEDFIKLAQGQLNTVQAYQQGRVKIKGDLNTAAKISDLFGAWAPGSTTTPTPTPQPQQPTTPTQPQQPSTPTPAGSVYPKLMNGSFDDYQPYIRDNEAKDWRGYPERYGAYWSIQVISEVDKRMRIMDSETFGKFTQQYFGGSGHDYHIHGRHSQVITGRYGFDVVLFQTVAAQPGKEYTFKGKIVTYFKGPNPPAVHDKIFKRVGIDPTGGRDYSAPTVVWGERDGRDNEWRGPSVKAKAKGNAVTVFIRIENTEKDVGQTDLNTIHLEDFVLE